MKIKLAVSLKLNKVKPGLLFILIIPLLCASSCQKDGSIGSTGNGLNSSGQNNSGATAGANSTLFATNQPISLDGKSNLTIIGDTINGGNLSCITLTNCSNIRITHCKLINSSNEGINLLNCSMIQIDSNYIANVSTGIYVLSSNSIKVVYNQMKNIQGPYPKGAFIQFNNVSGSNNNVAYNRLENIAGQSNPEDAISMFKSNGIAASPILITNNWIRGGGPSLTGGGIMLGDNGGSYQVATNNVLVNPGQYGMAVSGGTNMQIVNNTIYSVSEPFSNVGIYYWNQSGLPSSAVKIDSNKVKFASGLYGGENDFWIGSGSSTPIGWNTNYWGANIDASILPSTIITAK